MTKRTCLNAYAVLLLAASLAGAMAPASFAREPQGAAAPAKASPGAEAAAKKLLAGLAAGAPDYSMMGEQLAAATVQQLPSMKARLEALGPMKSIVFKEAGPQGGDNFDVTFANGALRLMIRLDAAGKVVGAGMRPLS